MYSHRRSMAPPGGLSTVRKQRQQRSDTPFRILDPSQIAEALNLILSFSVNEESLSQPHTRLVLDIYSDVVEYFLEISRDHMLQSVDKAVLSLEENNDQAKLPTIVEPNYQFALLRHAGKFLRECGVNDLSILDFEKPEPLRLRRHLSAIIAYSQFREARLNDHSEIIEHCRVQNEKYQRLWQESDELVRDINHIENMVRDKMQEAQKVQAENADRETELRQLIRLEHELMDEHNQFKEDKRKTSTRIDQLSSTIEQLQQESEKIVQFLSSSADNNNLDLYQGIDEVKRAIQNAEQRNRLLDITLEALKELMQDVRSCLKIQVDCEEAIKKLEQDQNQLSSLQESNETWKIKNGEMDTKIQQAQSQLEWTNERLTGISEQAEAKKAEAQGRLEQITQRSQEVVETRTLYTKEFDAKRQYIVAKNKEIEQMRHELEREMRSIAKESENLQTHINIYISRMDEKLETAAVSVAASAAV